VHFVIGAPGSGKSVVAGFVAARLPDFVVLDMDVLLDPVGALVGVDLRDAEAAHLWPAYNEVWVNLAAVLAKNRPVLLLGPLQPG
jgi:predicted kinase